ncbi:DUF2780 domain-containing protein [Paraglaciecola sp. MB-3u-78]|uniref:DUF2780 domain-containing protein n=1 Tax=Paraglaciecola sp. MB-3u-78 TaxID=2058332 RepID=UPI000C32A980|nr:DUF2780 domain-containing protein [Paraglaciecola sp. MB-3u-78]PKG99226.1 hypothetical protein CXF95_08065 [Paraglaciecola sp. MB-3u-78]
MKVSYLLIVVSALAFSPASHAEGWLDSIKGMFGMEAETPAMPNVTDMISSVSESVGIDESQAKGSLASVFNYAKENISAEQFSGLSDSLPGLDSLMGAVPDISGMSSEGGLGGLMDKAANYNASLKAVNELKKQFEALGLSSEMIMQVVNSAKTYLDTDEGQKIKEQLMKGLNTLSL